MRQWISSAGSYSALIYILLNAFEAQNMCWSLEMTPSSPPSPPPKADVSHLCKIWFMQRSKASAWHLHHFPSGELETKQSTWRSALCPASSTGVLGNSRLLGTALCLHSNKQYQWDRRLVRAVGPFQTWVTGSNSASHQVLEVIAVCRVLDGQQEVCWRTLFHQSTVHRSWH